MNQKILRKQNFQSLNNQSSMAVVYLRTKNSHDEMSKPRSPNITCYIQQDILNLSIILYKLVTI